MLETFSVINGTARIDWEFETATPLCIKSGTTSLWEQETSPKTRLVNATFDFFKKNSARKNISDFYYDVVFCKGRPRIRYKVPSSSVRGALRNHTIRTLVDKKYWNVFSSAEDEEAQGNKDSSEALRDPGGKIIQNLFGLAVEGSKAPADDPSIAGRLRVQVGELGELTEEELRKNLAQEGFNLDSVKFGSRHGRMIFSTRNPVDRITHAARAGGLHSFMELAPGNRFNVKMEIINPVPEDLGIVAFWENAIRDGLLRFGGIISSGRGRVKINKTGVMLYLRSPGPFNNLCRAGKNTADIISDIFKAYTITDWSKKRDIYFDQLKRSYENPEKT